MDDNPIRLTIGIATETDGMPMDFWIHKEGVEFGDCFLTAYDLTVARAVLLDLADALDSKIKELFN